jgi:hypothetical protein
MHRSAEGASASRNSFSTVEHGEEIQHPTFAIEGERRWGFQVAERAYQFASGTLLIVK